MSQSPHDGGESRMDQAETNIETLRLELEAQKQCVESNNEMIKGHIKDDTGRFDTLLQLVSSVSDNMRGVNSAIDRITDLTIEIREEAKESYHKLDKKIMKNEFDNKLAIKDIESKSVIDNKDQDLAFKDTRINDNVEKIQWYKKSEFWAICFAISTIVGLAMNSAK